MEILALIGPIAIKLLDLYLDKIAKDKEMRKKFLQLVDAMGERGSVSAKLRAQYAEKRARLENQGG